MPLYKTPAIVLRSISYSEADKIVTLYTLNFGKIKGIAKGAKRSRKRFGNTLETGSYITVSFFEKETAELVRLSHCDLIRPFEGLRKDIHKLAWASYLIELTNALTAERIKNKALFNLLIFFLTLIDQGVLKEGTQSIFEVRLLSLLGYQPHLDHCLRCKKGLTAETFFFDARAGGILCPFCASGLSDLIPISTGTIRTLQLAQTLPLQKVRRISFSPQSLKESQAVLSLFLQQYLGKELKSKKFLEQISLNHFPPDHLGNGEKH